MSVNATHSMTLGATVKRTTAPGLSGGETLKNTVQGGLQDANVAITGLFQVKSAAAGFSNYVALDLFRNQYQSYGTAALATLEFQQGGGGEVGRSLDGGSIAAYAAESRQRLVMIANNAPVNSYGYNHAVVQMGQTKIAPYNTMVLGPGEAVMIKTYSGAETLQSEEAGLDSVADIRHVRVFRRGATSAPYFSGAGALVYVSSLMYHPSP